MKTKISGKDLINIGYPQNKSIAIALGIITSHYKKRTKEFILKDAKKVLEAPETFVNDSIWGKVAEQLIAPVKTQMHQLLPIRVSHTIFGENEIEDTAKQQMYDALRLPVAVSGALMPDAHAGYGLPIGGVLAIKNAVIPYGVGVDIGCRMSLSIFDLNEEYFKGREHAVIRILDDNTKFGMEDTHRIKADHEVLSRSEFKEIHVLRQLHDRAYKQLGTSGGGNHFVEFGLVEITSDDFNSLKPGRYFSLLSHSGSRGLGANIARHFTKLASKNCPLPKQVQHLAWLDLSTHDGIEYWKAMNLAGDYARACHEDIHRRITKAIGSRVLCNINNHHNFAWKEEHNGETLIVHRKGATPAGVNELGIIPGSMTSPGFIIRGKGNALSLRSASHGAGRLYSRNVCKSKFTKSDMHKMLEDHGVHLIGGSVDEAPMAYKNIHTVMSLQNELVEVLGTFSPKFVKMDR